MFFKNAISNFSLIIVVVICPWKKRFFDENNIYFPNVS